MAGYQRFIIAVNELKDIEEVKEVLRILNNCIDLNCNPAGIDLNFRRENQWGCYPSIQIKGKKGYSVEVAHTGYYPDGLYSKLIAVKEKLQKRFRNTSIKYLNIERLREI